MNSFRHLQTAQTLPIHTVTARWGSKPCPEGRWAGYAPDWHVITVKHDPSDRQYPFWVQGWLPSNNTDGPAGETFIWKVPDLSCARYDLSEAVFLA